MYSIKYKVWYIGEGWFIFVECMNEWNGRKKKRKGSLDDGKIEGLG